MVHVLPTDLVNDTSGLIEGFALWAYSVTNGTFFTFMLLGFCGVLYMAASVYQSEKAFGYAATAGLLGAILLVTLKLMPWWVASAFIIAGVIGIATMILSKSKV